MPEFFSLIGRRWKLVLLISFLATLVALIACLLSPKQFLGEVTALPANAEAADRARIFGQSIEGLYRELGEPDELDKIEGTAKLDTIFLAVAKQYRFPSDNSDAAPEVLALHKTARGLKKNTRINRTAYGELKIRVWDKDPQMAANLANALLQQLNAIHQHLRTENNRLVLQRLKEDYSTIAKNATFSDSLTTFPSAMPASKAADLALYSRLIHEYELSLKTNPNALLVVEPARPLPWHDKPRTAQILLFTFLASLLFAFLLVFFADSRQNAV